MTQTALVECASCLSVLKNHEEVNAALTMSQSCDKISNQCYLGLSELVSVLLSFK